MYWQIQAIIEELITLGKEQYTRRPRLTLATAAIALLILLRGAGCAASALLTSTPPEDFDYCKVSGDIRYEDGSFVPAHGVLVCFYEMPATGSAQRSLGCVTLSDSADDFATTLRLPASDAVPQWAVITIKSTAGDELPAEVVPAEYASAETSPVRMNLRDRHVEIRIRKP